jgi:hypothetical protein
VSAPGTPAPSAVSAVSDRAQVQLGEPFRVVVELRHDQAQRYELRDTPPEAGPFALLRGSCATRHGALDGETRCEVDLALFELGTHAAVLRLDATGPGGARVVEVKATPVKAMTVTDPAIPAREIPLLGMPEPVPLFVPTWEPVAWMALGVAVGVSIAVAAVRRLVARLRAAEERQRAAPPSLTPSEALEARLDALETAPLAPAGAEPYFALSHAIRTYLAALSRPATLDRTTGEVLVALRAAPVGGLDLTRFAAFAAELDRAKYTGTAPSPEAWRDALAAARGILESTRPPRWDPGEEARRA